MLMGGRYGYIARYCAGVLYIEATSLDITVRNSDTRRLVTREIPK